MLRRAVWRRPWRLLAGMGRRGIGLLAQLGTVIGAIVLDQLPAAQDLVGITLVVAGVALHQLPADAGRDQAGA